MCGVFTHQLSAVVLKAHGGGVALILMWFLLRRKSTFNLSAGTSLDPAVNVI